MESMNPYSYCSNNPINYRDPTGLDDEEISKPSIPQVEVNDTDGTLNDPIQQEVNKHLGTDGQPYGKDGVNRCDDFAKDNLNGAGVNTSNLFADPFSSSDVSKHLKNAQDKKLGVTNPAKLEKGWYLVFMDDSQLEDKNGDQVRGHSGLLKVTDGKVLFYDASDGNTDHLPAEHELPSFSYGFNERHIDSYGHYDTKVFIPVKPE